MPCTRCARLARNIAADGEGASKLVTVNVTGAVNDEEADFAARAVANSPLVKTCIAGHDCNWGRVAMALGKCGVKFNQEDVSIDMMGMPVCRDGLTVPFDEDEALRRFEAPEIVVSADLAQATRQRPCGPATSRMSTSPSTATTVPRFRARCASCRDCGQRSTAR